MSLFLPAFLAALIGQPQPPNVLTPEEVRDGWLLAFDGATPFGWAATGEVRVADGVLRLSGVRDAHLEMTTAFGAFDLEFSYRVEGSGRALFRIQARGQPAGGEFLLPTREPGWHRATVLVGFDPTAGDATMSYQMFTPDGKARLKQPVSSRLHKAAYPRYLSFSADPGGELHLHSVKLRPHGLHGIFNGRDLSDWKEHPGRKSKFTVTNEGWLNVKDGNGDLQTEGQWGNFVLQLECISHGKHLNSGIFFRCRPGEYQQGYEAQIRNEFTPQPSQKYLIEEYDPKTHAFTGKKEVLSPAVDYGTGAIYRRQPARRGVAKDGAWFTLTVVAYGRHFATWVNGIQVTDWTDHRKPSDNARNGYREAKGPISIQGHDPTTDLSFRNLRIAELPPLAAK